MANDVLQLKVAEAVQDDVNKGIVRIDSTLMQEIGVRPGDIVEIEGARKTVGIADRSYPGDIGLKIIRMDGIVRKNGRTTIGELVKVQKAIVKEAKKVVIAPAKKGIIVRASPNTFKQGLLGRVALKGDIVSLGGTMRRRSAMSSSPFFEDIFTMIEEDFAGFGFSGIKFVVADVLPKQAVIITDSTTVVLNPEAIEVKDDVLPDITYEDIGGLDEEITKIREMVELPLKHPEIFERLGIDPPKGVLLYGPPGTGKTLLAKAVANETNSNFILINGPEVMSKFYGQSEENLRKKFEEAEKNAPSIIFIDEIDAIASKREETHGEVERRVVAQLLAIMDGLKSRGKVVVIAASNIPNSLDPALRRPGRFDREIEIGIPRKAGRLKVLRIHTRNMPMEGTLHTDILSERVMQELGSFLKENQTSKAEIEKKLTTADVANSDSVALLKNTLHKTDEKIVELEKIRTYLDKRKSLQKIIRLLEIVEHKKELWDDSEKCQEFIKRLTKKHSAEIAEYMSFFLHERVLSKKIYSTARNVGKERDMDSLANITHGFVGADLAALAKEAAMVVLRRILPDLRLDQEDPVPLEILEKLVITNNDFKEALRVVRPSALREVLIEVPNVRWHDIGGLEGIKQELKEAVEWPLKNPESFTRLGVSPPKGILMFGAPGTGKTLLAKAVARESEANFILVKGPELLSKWIGESEKAVRKVFEKARQTAPTIIFFDEIDALAPTRGVSGDNKVTERVVNQLLTEIDGLESLHEVIIIGATNRPDIIDAALLRPGRFDRILLAPVPDVKSRERIFEVHTKGMPLEGVDIYALAEKTEGYVGSDIESLCREAAILALREDMKATVVTDKHFETAMGVVRASVTKDIEEMYASMQGMFRSAQAKQMKDDRPHYMG